MSHSSLNVRAPHAANPPVTPAHLLILLYVSVGAAVWGAAIILGSGGIQFEQYLLLAGLLGLASAIFIFARTKGNSVGVFEVPVFLTMVVFLRFALAPIDDFLNPAMLNPQFDGHYELILRALFYVSVGMFAFWAGCSLLPQHKNRRSELESAPDPQMRGADPAILAWAVAIYTVVFATQLYLLHAHLFAYVGSWKAYHAHLASLQVLQVITLLGGPVALILVTIERYLYPQDSVSRALFWAILLLECAWGLASGMKGFALKPLFIVAIVSSLIERRFNKRWIAAMLFALVVLYPVMNNYRRLVLQQGGVTSVTDAATTGLKAVSETQQNSAERAGWLQNGWNLSVKRVDLLGSFGLALTLGPRASVLKGRERWWMIPYYPFVPRFIWKSKPILNEGTKFSAALGYGDRTSTAITYPGDLCVRYGLPGLLLGMFLLGVAAQWLTNKVSGPLDRRNLFIYAAVFLTFTNMEMDAFGFWTTVIKKLVILGAIAFIVYGPRRRGSRAPGTSREATTRP